MAVAIVCDGCGAVGPVAQHAVGQSEDAARAQGWGYGSRPFVSEIGGMTFSGGWRTVFCPDCLP